MKKKEKQILLLIILVKDNCYVMQYLLENDGWVMYSSIQVFFRRKNNDKRRHKSSTLNE